ncbi:MAG: BtrH N-terminal domain-containing protein [Candidatus Bathyarchaeia archaeon]
MRRILKGFVHRPGVHCDSSALRDVFEYHGFRFSEPMIFGLGSGLGFTYWETKQAPYPFVGGRGRDLDGNLCENLGMNLGFTRHPADLELTEP